MRSDRVVAMSTETNTVDPVEAILAATFGPNIAAEVVATPEVEAQDACVSGPSRRFRDADAPALKLDGTPKKKTQRIEVTGFGFGSEAKREISDTRVIEALLDGAESLVDLQAATGLAKLTVKRALERLAEGGKVTTTKALPSGKRGRPAHLYRAAVEAISTVSEPVREISTRQDPVSGPINGIVVTKVSA
jgi:hypothetical protein